MLDKILNKIINDLWDVTREFESVAFHPIREKASKPTRYLLRECRLSIEQDRKRLLVEPPTRTIALALIRLRSRKRELANLAYNLALNWVTIYFEGTELVSFKSMPSTILNDPAADKALIDELWACRHSASIVRLSDSFCFMTNNEPTKRFTDLDPSVYWGSNVANLWVPDEYNRLLSFLDKDGEVNTFEYEGYRKIDVLKGIYVPVKMAGNFRKVLFMGHECRYGEFRFN